MFREYVARDDELNALYNHLKPSNLRPYLFLLVTICTPCTEDTQAAILVDLSLSLSLSRGMGLGTGLPAADARLPTPEPKHLTPTPF